MLFINATFFTIQSDMIPPATEGTEDLETALVLFCLSPWYFIMRGAYHIAIILSRTISWFFATKDEKGGGKAFTMREDLQGKWGSGKDKTELEFSAMIAAILLFCFQDFVCWSRIPAGEDGDAEQLADRFVFIQ